jgi:hypothetical protein
MLALIESLKTYGMTVPDAKAGLPEIAYGSDTESIGKTLERALPAGNKKFPGKGLGIVFAFLPDTGKLSHPRLSVPEVVGMSECMSV